MKKNMLSAVLLLSGLILLGTPAQAFAQRHNPSAGEQTSGSEAKLKGDGTERSPYLISTERELRQAGRGQYSGGAYYQLKKDISLSEGAWEPIPTFSGVFDGNGCKISNIRINSSKDNDYVGFFYSNTGTVKELGADVNINSTAAHSSAGGLAGYNSGSITQCYSTGAVSSSGYCAGGLVGANTGSISNCYSLADVRASDNTFAGGLAGAASERSDISFCYAAGRIKAKNNKGGIAGYVYSGRIKDCYYNKNEIGSVTNNEGTGLSSNDMKKKENFRNWDFFRIWGVSRRNNGGYPYLQSFV
ncbi:MAG: hypothetical protein LBB94_11625 [Clostridiales bacterium]|nr:hypothetical protein [Clostridiales bacterium]